MHRFYVNRDISIGDLVSLQEKDTNHIKNVLRMKKGDNIVICDGQGKDYYCIIDSVGSNEIIAKTLSCENSGTELASKIILFQGLPKQNKMELIIQKAVELGVSEIVPVSSKRTVANLKDQKRQDKKIARWQDIAESAGKQSRRGVIPIIKPVLDFNHAVKYAQSLDLAVIAYEKADDMTHTKTILKNLKQYKTIGVFIGPEGGFDEAEVDLAQSNNIKTISLGKRILRTETASITILSIIMLDLEP